MRWTANFKNYRMGGVGFFIALHAAAIGVFFSPFSWSLVALLIASYGLRMFGVTGGYHRYFSHRSYKLGRVAQFCMGFLAQTSAQKGILWWAANHRQHHRHSDQEHDIHSPWTKGFWWSHVGWVLSNEHDEYDPKAIADFAKFPELRWLDKWHWVPTVIYAAAVLAIGGWPAFFWGYVLSTVLLYHGTFAINSISHLWGSKRFPTGDESRNNFVLAIVTLGEGWHNNHHFSVGSCRQGFLWWEIDITYAVIKAMSWLRIARDIRPPRLPRTRDAFKPGVTAVDCP
ncbi:MAG: fatty acid desaturase [Bryobacteraceae bacterium]